LTKAALPFFLTLASAVELALFLRIVRRWIDQMRETPEDFMSRAPFDDVMKARFHLMTALGLQAVASIMVWLP
jgi:hypothetical protein